MHTSERGGWSHPWFWKTPFDCGPFGRRRGHGGHGPHGHGPPPGPPPPPWFFHVFGGPPPRAERGEVRYLILAALAEQARHGYEIIQVIEERSGGAYRPSPGTVYPTLQMLEELGQVRATEQEGRKIYELTDAGREELEAHQDEVEDAYDRFAESSGWPAGHAAELHEIAERVHRMVRHVVRAFRRGSVRPQQLRDIRQVIGEAADRIEAILRQR